MTILGVESLIFGVEDLAECTRYFDDFGLILDERGADRSRFVLPEGSSVVLKPHDAADLPRGTERAVGVREIVWGVDDRDHLDRLAADLSRDLAVTADADGTVHFDPGFGVPMALRYFARKRVTCAPDQLNAPDAIQRLNRPRKWRRRAYPKVINHVVFAAVDYEAAGDFMCRRLGFKVTDTQVGYGVYMRAPGTRNHHTFLLVNADLPLPDFDGKAHFHHVNFGVEDLDEIMLGVNHMVRRGWRPSEVGLGRHRIDSGLFYYMPSPLGGEMEYGADADYVDDSWVPRRWPVPLFGYAHFTHNLPEFMHREVEWKVEFFESEAELQI